MTLVDDRWDEENETFTVELSNPTNARIQDSTATGRIMDNDPQMEAALVPPENKRVDEDTIHPVRFLVELDTSESLASERGAYLNWTVTPDTATHGEDYVESGGSIVIPPGDLRGAFEVHLVNDDLFERTNERFTVTLTRERWVLVDPDNNSGNIKIKDDDRLYASVLATAENVVEGHVATFRIWASGSRSIDEVLVTYETEGSATSGVDYIAPPGTVRIPVGQWSFPVAIKTKADGVYDPNETLVVRLTGALSVGRGVRLDGQAKSATVTILDDRNPPPPPVVDDGVVGGALRFTTVSVEGDDGTEGEDLQFTVRLSSTSTDPVQVLWTTEPYGSVLSPDEQATPGVDYQVSNGTVTIPAGHNTGMFTVATIEDDLAENTERFLVKLTGTVSDESVALGIFSAEGLILDDDEPPSAVTLSVTPVAVPEGATSTELSVTATLNGTTTRTEATSVLVTVVGDTATEGEDYTAGTATLVIAASSLSQTGLLNLTPIDDLIAEGDETVEVVGTSGELSVATTTVSITDNDAEPTGVTLMVTPSSVSEGDGDAVLNVKAVLTGGGRRPVDTPVTLSVDGDDDTSNTGTTTAASANDFSVGPGPIILIIPAGEMEGKQRLTLTLVDDYIVEGVETAQVRGAAGDLTVTPARLTITDDDSEPTGIELSVTPSDLNEQDGATVLQVTATLTGGTVRPADTTVSLSLHDLSTVSGEDYTAPANVELVIPAESLVGTSTLTLTLLNDDIHENQEELAVRGTNTDPGLPVAGSLVSIADDDAAPTRVELDLDREKVQEDAGLQRLVVTGTLTGGSKRTVDTPVTLTAHHLTTTDGDYSFLPSALTIGSRSLVATTTLLLAPMDDPVDEEDEVLEVRGSTYEPGLSVSTKQVVITDDDTAGVTLSTSTLTIVEGRSSNYTVVLDSQPSADVTVIISGQAGTVVSLSSTSTLTFTAENWNTSQTVTVDAGRVTTTTVVTLSHAVSGGDYDSVTAGDVTVTVVNDDPAVSVGFATSTYTVVEGATTTIRLVLSAEP